MKQFITMIRSKADGKRTTTVVLPPAAVSLTEQCTIWQSTVIGMDAERPNEGGEARHRSPANPEANPELRRWRASLSGASCILIRSRSSRSQPTQNVVLAFAL